MTYEEREIERLKDDYSKLQELFAQYQMASDKEIIAQKKEAEKRFGNNMKSVLEIEKKQAKIDVLNELKEKYGFYSCYSFKNDVKSLSEIIDELIKEVKMKLFTKTKRPEDYKILLVEDGSIDIDDLAMFIDEHNLKIKIVVYRAGSVPPRFLKQSEE